LAELAAWNGDQADGLRRLFGNRCPQVVAFASGREACGRTTLVVQSAVALAASGHGVVIIDENPAPDNAVTAFGLAARHDFLHVVRGERSLAQVVLPAAPMVHILPAARAARELDRLGDAGQKRLSARLRDIQQGAGFVLIDCATRRSGHLSLVATSARHLVVVVAAQGTAITQAYALIKRIAQDQGRDNFQIAVTRARSPEEARAIYDNMRRVAREHLGVRLDYLGAAAVPVTDHLANALIHGLPPAVDSGEMDGFLPMAAATALRPGVLDSVV
jgi:flagellar biosynthesis protein FlhG